MANWDIDKVKELAKKISNTYENAVVVGVYGDRNNRKKKLRVYISGGKMLEIPLPDCVKYGGRFKLASEKYGEYFNKIGLTDEQRESLKKLRDIVGIGVRYWTEEQPSEFEKLLDNYLTLADKAAEKKFSTSDGKEKERNLQTRLFKKYLTDASNDYAFMDFEFQTTKGMNGDTEENGDCPKRGKPDYVAIHEGGFYLIELKVNNGAMGGKSGLIEHHKDFERLIRENNGLAEELQDRLKYMCEYELINENYRTMAKGILDKKPENLTVEARYIFITSPDFTEDWCIEQLKRSGIDKKFAFFVDRSSL